MTPKTAKHITGALKLAVTLALLAAALRLIRLDALLESLRDADPGWLAVAAALLLLGGFAGAASWFCILRLRLPALAYREAAACHWSGMFFNSFLPSNVGGDVVKGYIVARDQGQAVFVVASLLLDRAINLGMLVSIGVFALLLQRGHRLCAAGFLALLALGLAAVIALARRFQQRTHAWPQAGLRGKLARLLAPAAELAATPRLLAPALLAGLASQLLKTWHNVFLIHALGLAIPTFCVWYVIPLFGVVSALPLSVGGLGLREMVAQLLSGPLALDNTHLVTLSLAGHLMTVLVNMLGLVPFLLRKSGRR